MRTVSRLSAFAGAVVLAAQGAAASNIGLLPVGEAEAALIGGMLAVLGVYVKARFMR